MEGPFHITCAFLSQSLSPLFDNGGLEAPVPSGLLNTTGIFLRNELSFASAHLAQVGGNNSRHFSRA